MSLCSIDCSPSRSLDPSLLIGVLLILTTESEKAWLHGEVIGSGSLMVSTSPRQGAGASYFGPRAQSLPCDPWEYKPVEYDPTPFFNSKVATTPLRDPHHV